MTDDGDRLVTAISVALGVFILIGIALLIFAAMNVPSDGSGHPPQASWTLDRVNATHVRITHAGGEPVSTTNLSVTVNGARRSLTWAGTFTESDTGLVAARPNAEVQLYWIGGRGDRVLLKRWDLGDTETATR